MRKHKLLLIDHTIPEDDAERMLAHETEIEEAGRWADLEDAEPTAVPG